MAQEVQQEAAVAEAETLAVDDFASLLRKEFKPNTEVREQRIERAGRTRAQQALSDAEIVGDDVFTTVDAMKAAIDRTLTEQINLIIHHPDFQKLESAWKGLWYLVGNTSTGKDLK